MKGKIRYPPPSFTHTRSPAANMSGLMFGLYELSALRCNMVKPPEAARLCLRSRFVAYSLTGRSGGEMILVQGRKAVVVRLWHLHFRRRPFVLGVRRLPVCLMKCMIRKRLTGKCDLDGNWRVCMHKHISQPHYLHHQLLLPTCRSQLGRSKLPRQPSERARLLRYVYLAPSTIRRPPR
jgi:hypothetical protein